MAPNSMLPVDIADILRQSRPVTYYWVGHSKQPPVPASAFRTSLIDGQPRVIEGPGAFEMDSEQVSLLKQLYAISPQDHRSRFGSVMLAFLHENTAEIIAQVLVELSEAGDYLQHWRRWDDASAAPRI